MDLWRFIAPVSLYLLILNALMFLDTWIIKALVEQQAAAAGQAEPAAVASQAAGLYGMAQAIARLPYQLILSVTFVIFPLVSQATFAADLERTRGYIDKAMRLSLIIVLALAVSIAARPEALLYLAKREYLAAAPSLSVLVVGYVFFSLFSIAGTILNGAGKTRATMTVGAATLVVQAGLIYGAMRWAMATGRDPLVWAAAGTTAGMGVGFALSLAWLQRSFGASLRVSTMARVALAAAVAIGVARLMPLAQVLGPEAGKVKGIAVTTPVSGVAVAVYVALLFLTRELSQREVSGLLRRDRAGARPPAA
jgi:O-antigen/teichoic acid export membrane protein